MNNTEIFIKDFYESINVYDPSNLSIEFITKKIDLPQMYWEHSSLFGHYDDWQGIFINSNINKQRQWQEFGHEMCHYFRDDCNRHHVSDSFVDYCETKADYFAYHFCVPTFMLANLKEVSVNKIMFLFNVEFDFAMKRFEMYKNQIIMKGAL